LQFNISKIQNKNKLQCYIAVITAL